MIEINRGTLEEQVIKLLQKKYPITITQIQNILNLSNKTVRRVLNKFQVQGIVVLDVLPDKIYIRLLRNDFNFIAKKRQRKFIKHSKNGKKQESEKYNGIMYS